MIRISICLCLLLVGSLGQLFKIDTISQEHQKMCANEGYRRPNIFTVTGEGAFFTEPTIGVIRLGIETKRLEADEALAHNKLIVSETTSAVLKLNSDLKITTQGLTVGPRYEQSNGESKFVGYTVNNNIILKTCEKDQLGRLIDIAIKSGVTQIQSVSFEIDPATQKISKEQLIELAVKDAQQRARRVLDEIGYRIVGVKSVQINQNQGNYYRPRAQMAMAMMADGAGSASTEVFAGQQRQNQKVTIGYIIEPLKA